MNKEIVKAMNKKKDKSAFHKWWDKNSYKINRVILFPIWFGYITKKKIQKKLNARQVWSEERVKAILDYYIPRKASWIAEEKEFYFFDNGYGWSSINLAKKYLKRKDRRWWKKHTGWGGGDIRKYLIEQFELEGFTKEVVDTYDGYTEIIFKLNEK